MSNDLFCLGRWLLSVLVAIPYLTLVCLAGIFSRRRAWFLFRGWSRIQCRLLGIKVEVENRNREDFSPSARVYAQLNQTSVLEALYWVMALPVPCRFIENVEFALIPFLGWASVAIGGIPIVRQWPWQARRGLKRAERCLRNKEGVCISLEGRRSPDGRLSPFKKGPVVLALSTQAEIIPMVFRGADERLPYGEWRPKPGVVRVVFCEAISTKGLALENRHELVSRLHEIAELELAES